MDEAFTYLYFAARPLRFVWEPGTNNHVLNTLLMWITTRVFGDSSVVVRMPSLLGAALYVFVCYFLCKTIAEEFSLRLPLFLCLTCNPFILDFMVAARGYSLADAFLLAAIAIPVWSSLTGRFSLQTSCALASLALGLSFSANFSFGFVDGAAFLVLLTWAMQRRKEQSIMRVAAYCALPGLFAALLIGGYPLSQLKKDDYVLGAHSLREMRQSLVQSSFYQLDTRFSGSRWYKTADYLRPRLPPLLIVLCLCKLVAAGLDRSWLHDARGRWLGRFMATLAGITALCLTASWLAFRFYQLPLPAGRTGIYLAPLCTLFAGVIAAVPARSSVSRGLSRGIAAVLVCVACYFLLCLRLSYFREYKWDADVKDVYSVLSRLNHTYGITDVEITGLYVTALNYYRVSSHRETFPEFKMDAPELSPGRSIYVLNRVDWREFVEKEKLTAIYRGRYSDVIVALRPNGPIPPTNELPSESPR
jgi:4-amino-4-deoxy-L-arabinose transferase-like glycosyltransferase